MDKALEANPDLQEILDPVLSVFRLNGLTNRVYRVTTPGGDFALRLPRPENAGLIDRQAEAHNLALAGEQGIAPPALVLDPRTGILLTRAIGQGGAPGSVEPAALGRLVGRLHSAPLRFRGMIDPDGLIAHQRASLSGRPDLLSVFDPLADALARLGPVADAHGSVPSHGDLSPGNVLAGSDGPVLIDWEYSAMASPAWDLAYAILEHEFDPGEERAFLEAYAAHRPGMADPVPEILRMKVRCDAVSVLWALDQARKGNASADFDAFARTRLERALGTFARLSG
ncbi:choline kinase family protein [Roseibium aggregatum]|uniref:Phosphotransferase n=1 Tax=Roseibium aggregatum TaxID=187304 RepID=A0A926NTJ9_9HYPH|nr:choline kinase family protein [Roseibium aggregatum]MBD1547152.1 phosphotransferase [Roseibium aggregatum]